MTVELGRLCSDAGHDERCLESCLARTGCAVGRKHYVHGGVCCLSCFSGCTSCEGSFYVEHLYYDQGDDPYYPSFLCHCCALEAGKPWTPYRPSEWS